MYQREKALYEQKIQFLELHLHEAREREENLKKMNENIMSAFNDLSSGRSNLASKATKDLQAAMEAQNSELVQQKLRAEETIKALEEKLSLLQLQHSEALKRESEPEEENLNFERERELLTVRNKLSETERTVCSFKGENAKLLNQVEILEKRLKEAEECYGRDLRREEEREELRVRAEMAEAEGEEKEEKIKGMKKENESLVKKVESLSNLVKEGNEDVQEREEEICALNERIGDLSSELKLLGCLKQENAVLKSQAKEFRSKILKLETSEVSLKKGLKDKESVIGSLMAKLNSEENEIEEELLEADVSHEFTTTPIKRNEKHLEYMMEDSYDERLYPEELTSRKTVEASMNQRNYRKPSSTLYLGNSSTTNANGRQRQISRSNRNMGSLERVSHRSYERSPMAGSSQRKLCQNRSIERPSVATALVCEFCNVCLPPSEFMEHIQNCRHSSHYGSKTSKSSNSRVHPQPHPFPRTNPKNTSPHLDHSPNNHLNSFQVYTTEEFDAEKREIIERLKEVEFQLQLTEGKNDILLSEKGNLEHNLNRIVKELAKTKMDWAISEEMKDECESALKSEIKFLISKLLKAKGKLSEQKSISQNSSLLNCSSQLNSSALGRAHSPISVSRQPFEPVSRNDLSMLNHSVSSISTNSKSSNVVGGGNKGKFFSSNTFLRNRTPKKGKDKSSLAFTDSEMNDLKSSRNQMMKKESFFAKKYLK